MSRRRPLIALLAIVLLGGLCARAAVLGSEGATAFDANLAFDAATPASPQALAFLRDGLSQASREVPGDPAPHELLGLLELRTNGASAAGDEFERALARRPVAPITWADLATQRYRAGNTDATFRIALLNAARLGPSEPGVQAIVANLGLAVWSELTADERGVVEGRVAAGMRRDSGQFLQIAGRRGRLDVACRHFPSPPRQADMKWIQTCQGMEATS